MDITDWWRACCWSLTLRSNSNKIESQNAISNSSATNTRKRKFGVKRGKNSNDATTATINEVLKCQKLAQSTLNRLIAQNELNEIQNDHISSGLKEESKYFIELLSNFKEQYSKLSKAEQLTTHFENVHRILEKKFQRFYEAYSHKRKSIVKKLIAKAKSDHKVIKNSSILRSQQQHRRSNYHDLNENASRGHDTLPGSQQQQYALEIEDKAEELEKSLMIQERALEIVELQRSFAFQVQQQSEMVSRINDHLMHAHEDIGMGTKRVSTEAENYKHSSNWQASLILMLAILLLIFHFMN